MGSIFFAHPLLSRQNIILSPLTLVLTKFLYGFMVLKWAVAIFCPNYKIIILFQHLPLIGIHICLILQMCVTAWLPNPELHFWASFVMFLPDFA